LITPKLLPDLEYNNRVKVHCIYNGPMQPPKEQWSVDHFISLQRATMRA